ncbi:MULTISPECIES: hypothetical protein [Geobacter]|uniref:hypothetical protein n=1 Tax=Geobacter TaxID=28231 RepID=UPI002573A4F5|nr:hypothetical protein [Geobacter sulfurreducens]BEH11035.1 hypothetical protein GSUET_26470 [Geobacter sulfurreducens subsp. ethanolicus]BET58881.1 hypothetical protein GEO60473_19210 [Geobacter sp. 60473]
MRVLFVAIICVVISIQLAMANEIVNKNTPAENLKRAKGFIKAELPREAKTFLDAIPKTAPEYKEAKRLYTKLPALMKLEEQELSKMQAEERKEFAKSYEMELDYKGISSTVSVQGKGNTTLKINCALRRRLANDQKLLASLRQLNFKNLLVSDGVTLTTVTLN